MIRTTIQSVDGVIHSFRGAYSYLSNFSRHSVELDGIKYPTLEHAYQAAKTELQEERERILKLPTPGSAKRAGRECTVRPDWDNIKVSVMKQLVKCKFSKHPVIREWLLDTYPIYIVEGNDWGDRFWGVTNVDHHDDTWSWIGDNHLGEILMEVRGELIIEAVLSNGLMHQIEKLIKSKGIRYEEA